MERGGVNNEKFIQEIYKRRSLWDQKSLDYLNRSLKVKDWESVAQEMSSTIEEVKNRWKLLKDSFNREVRNMTKNSNASSKWAHFEQMSFLLKGTNSLLLPTAYLSQSLTELDNTASSSFDNELSENSLTVPEEDSEVRPPPQKKKLKTSHSRSHASSVYNMNSTQSESNQQADWNTIGTLRPDYANEDYYFLMSLLPTFERMTPRQKMLVKIKMMQDVYEAAFTDSNSQPNHNHSGDSCNYFDPVSSGS